MLAHGGQRVTAAITGSGVRQAAAAIPVASVRDALLSAYQTGFAETFNHLMDIASVIAIVGALGCLVLVRQRDFVPSTAPAHDAPDAVAGGRAHAGPEPTAAEPTGRGTSRWSTGRRDACRRAPLRRSGRVTVRRR